MDFINIILLNVHFLHQQQQLQQKLDNSSTSTSNTNFQDSMNHNELFTDYHLSRPDDIRF